MADHKFIGKDFLPPDVVAKVTGKAKYAEDFRAEGMVFAKLLRSPMPHGEVRKIDTSGALKMKGVLAVLTADDLPKLPPFLEPALTNHPLYAGEPIAAVAAVNEATCAAALDAIKVDMKPLPFVINPLDSLRPGGPNANPGGNVANVRLPLQTIKWKAKDFAGIEKGILPMGKPAEQWSYGDLEAGFKKADLVLEESFTTQAMSHHSMEPRTALAYWQGGKVYLHGSSQSMTFMIPDLTKMLGVKPDDLVYISENTGGGFGSKGTPYAQMVIPVLLSKKINRPVLLRVTRDEEHSFGRARAGYQGHVKLGFRKDGRIVAADTYVIQANGPYIGFWDFRNFGNAISVIFQPEAMRWQGISVLTNTPPRGPQRGPGENQTAMALEPLIDNAAKKLGLDRVAIRLINAPGKGAKMGGKQVPLTSAYLPEALKMGAEKFDWANKIKESGKRNGSKVTGIGVASAYHSAGASGFTGLCLIRPDGKLYIHSGPGNLGTYSYASTARVYAEVLDMPWDKCEIVHGSTGKHLPFVLGQFGSNTSFTVSRANYVTAMDAKTKLQEIAAKKLGGKPEDYEVGGARVFQKANSKKGITFAAAAKEAIKLGGKYSGKEVPKMNPFTTISAAALSGQGLMGVGQDTKHKGYVAAMCAGFAKVEVDMETGSVEIQEYLGVLDCGTVVHPQSLATQIKGGAVQGFGMALNEKHIYDPKYGIPATRGFHTSKPPTYLDVPLQMGSLAVNKPDPENPLGIKGAGEPPMGAGAAAVVCAVSDALGKGALKRAPLTADLVLNTAEGRATGLKPFDVDV